jgi:hypothetical protein
MNGTDQNASPDPNFDIRIVGLNTEKTRKMIGSETVYQVYLELSSSPSLGWRTLFDEEWKALNSGQPLSLQETSIDRAFLVIHCPLEDISKHSPDLIKAVASTNIAYKQYVSKQASDLKSRENVWKDERKIVEDVAKSLHFE